MLKLPCGWPLGFFGRSLNPEMKTSFVLITNWNFDVYSVAEFGDDAGKRGSNTTSVQPRLANRD